MLCAAWLAVSGDPVVGTDQRGVTFFTAVREAWIVGMRGRGGGESFGVDRSVGSVDKTWQQIKKGASAFASQFLAVQRMKLTGNPTDEELIAAALARHEGTDVYEAIRAHRAVATRAPVGKRKKNALRKWVPCWKVLRSNDKWSGAAGAAPNGLPAGRVSDDSDSDVETDDPSGGNPAVGKAFNKRPIGNKAAKRIKREDRSMTKEMKASTAALAALAQASRERTAVAFFHLPEMRDSPQAALFLQAQARKMLEAVGLDTDARDASTASVAPSGLSAATGSGSAAGGSEGVGGGSGSTTGPAVFEILDEGESGEEIEEVEAPPAEGMAAPLADGMAAPPVGGLAAPPALSRGVKAQMTKAAAAAAALASTLATTLDVDGDEPPTPPPAGKDVSEEEDGGEDEEEEGDEGDSDDDAESDE